MPAVTIDDCITSAQDNIARVSYGVAVPPTPPSQSLLAQTNLWIAGVFGPAGVFPPADNGKLDPGQRVVTNWYYTHLAARDSIEGPAPGAASIGATALVINAVVRALYAVKDGTLAGNVTTSQRAAIIALFNVVWP